MTATGNRSGRQEGQPLHVVMYQPEIPQNTGNIGRTCVAIGAKLWIVRPFAFQLDSAHIRRSGLDYWHLLTLEVVDDWAELLKRLAGHNLWLVTKFGKQSYFDARFAHGDVLVIGQESGGLPQSIRRSFPERQIMVPMPGEVRCLNQATCTGIVMLEAARQIGLLDGVAPCPEAI